VRPRLLRLRHLRHQQALDDSRDAEVMASSFRTDPRCFWTLAVADLIVVELREWSRITEDLGVERNRLVNPCASSSGAIFRPCSSSETTLPNGCSNSGRPRRCGKKRAGCAKHRSPPSSSATASAAWTRGACATCCESRRCKSPLELSRPRARMSLRSYRASACSTARSKMPVAAGRPDRPPRFVRGVRARAEKAAWRGDPRILARSGKNRPRHAARRGADYLALRSLTGGRASSPGGREKWVVVRRRACHPRPPTRATIGSASPFSTTREDAADALTAAPCAQSPTASVAWAMLKFGTTFDPSLPLKKPLDKRWGVPREAVRNE